MSEGNIVNFLTRHFQTSDPLASVGVFLLTVAAVLFAAVLIGFGRQEGQRIASLFRGWALRLATILIVVGIFLFLIGRARDDEAPVQSPPNTTPSTTKIKDGGTTDEPTRQDAQRIGPFRIALQDLRKASREERGGEAGTIVAATFEIANNSDNEWLVGVSEVLSATTAIDNLSHYCELSRDTPTVDSRDMGNALSVSAAGMNQMTLIFGCSGVDISSMGDRYNVTLSLLAFGPDGDSASAYSGVRRSNENGSIRNYSVNFQDRAAK